MPNHQNNFSTNLTSNTSAGATTSPINSIPSSAAPFYIAFDANNINNHYEVRQITSKTGTDVLHAATSYDHTTAETVSMIVPAEEMDALSTGWQAAPGTWTYSSADSPTFVFTTSIDMSSFIGVGARIKLTQTTAKYFIVTAISGTTVTIYGGTDYTLANAAITSPFFSIMQAPVGFPLDPAKWTLEYKKTSDSTTASPTGGAWNNGSDSLAIHIGAWDVYYQAAMQIRRTATTDTDYGRVTLSTANNSESDTEMTSMVYLTGASGTLTTVSNVYRRQQVTLAAKASYYLNYRTDTSISTSGFIGSVAPTIIRAVCAYL